MEGRVWATVHYIVSGGSGGSCGSSDVFQTSVSLKRNTHSGNLSVENTVFFCLIDLQKHIVKSTFRFVIRGAVVKQSNTNIAKHGVFENLH